MTEQGISPPPSQWREAREEDRAADDDGDERERRSDHEG